MNRLLQLFFSLLKLVSMPIINFITLLLGIRFYGKENWGEFISISIWIFFFAFIAKWSGQNYIVKEMSKNASNYLSVFYSNMIERSLLLLPVLILFIYFPFPVALSSIALLILIYIYNSYDALLVFKQKLQLQLFAEIIGIIIIFIGFYWFPNFKTTTILNLFCLSYFIKIILILGNFKLQFNFNTLQFSFQNLIKTYPFFLIGFSGWMASKCDIYVVNYFFSKKELSEYQMLVNCFLILQSIPSYIVLPINKHLFRLPLNIVEKIKSKILYAAIPIVIIATFIIWLFLKYKMQIEFSYLIYIFAALSTLPTFYYTVDVFQILRKEKEKKIMQFSFIIVMINLTLIMLLLPILRILGVVISLCLSQWLFLLLIFKENKNAKL